MSNNHVGCYDYDASDAASEAYKWKQAGGEVRLHGPSSGNGEPDPHFHLNYPGVKNRSTDFVINVKKS